MALGVVYRHGFGLCSRPAGYKERSPKRAKALRSGAVLLPHDLA